MSQLAYTTVTKTPDETRALGASLAPFLHPDDVIVLEGDLGAGKTRFAQGVARGLGVTDQVTSPTYNILEAYDSGRLPFYHFDLYRIDDESQLEDIGFFETIEADGVACIEWGSRFENLVTSSYLEVTISSIDDGRRRAIVRAYGTRARGLLTVWASDDRANLTKYCIR